MYGEFVYELNMTLRAPDPLSQKYEISLLIKDTQCELHTVQSAKFTVRAGGEGHRGPLPLRPQRTPASAAAVQAQREAAVCESRPKADGLHRHRGTVWAPQHRCASRTGAAPRVLYS